MRYSTERLYNETKLFNINQIYILQSVIFIHTKYKKQPVQHAYSTRLITENKIEENAYKKSRCQKFLSFSGLKYHNIIPNSIRNIKSLPLFIKRIKEFIFQNSTAFLK